MNRRINVIHEDAGHVETQKVVSTASILAIYHLLWEEFHTKKNPDLDWFLGWIARVPNISCGCQDWIRNYIRDNPPRFDDWFTYTWELHNAVNAKLGKLQMCFETSEAIWGQIGQQPSIAEFVAVTSLSPRRLERQTTALDSWKRFGLIVVSVNTPDEIELMQAQYPQVDRWVANEKAGCPTQPISRLANVTIDSDMPVLLINSDIEIHGYQSALVRRVRERRAIVGIRHNYTRHIYDSKREQWGLDAFLVYPELAKTFPERTPFAIGKPMWDYWLPWHLEQLGVELDWIGDPLFFHELHPITWTQEECLNGREWIKEHYPNGDVDWVAWRHARPFTYSDFSTSRDLRTQRTEWDERNDIHSNSQ